MNNAKRLLKWAERNERHLGAVLFVFGFVTDLITFALLPVNLVAIAFLGYLALAGVCTLGSHIFGNRQDPTVWRRTLAVVFPLGAQYAIGSLLSGCLIFYTKSSAVFVSWPFLLILALVFIGNEYFRTYYKYLAFQIVLFFFAIYAYTIFALPLLLNRLGPWIFALSTIISLVIFALFLILLNRFPRPAFTRGLRYIVPSTLILVMVMNISYFNGLIPPIPLSMPHAAVYHSLERRDGNYVLGAEPTKAWWDPRPQVIHHVPGTPLYAFTTVSAPIQFGASVIHVWEWHNPETKRWEIYNRVQFPISGGRDGGYRGYSEITNPKPGQWRITISTASRQVIGRIYVTVKDVETEPALTEEVR